MAVLPPAPTQRLGGAMGLVLELDTVLVGMGSRVPMKGQSISMGWSQGSTQVRTHAIWIKVDYGAATGAE